MRRGRAAIVGLALAAAAGVAAAGPHAAKASLEGTWDLGSYTDLERPPGVKGLVMSRAEAEAYEAPRRALNGMLPGKPGEVGQAENEFTDRGAGLAVVKGQIRSSWIVEPADGKIPYRPKYAAVAGVPGGGGAPATAAGGLDNPEEMGGTTRCVATVAAGAPMLAAPDANVLQIVQTKDHVAILSEKYHDVRIIRLFANARAAAAAGRDPPAFLGSSVGWWDGPALMVETRNFHAGLINKGQRIMISATTRVTERLERVSPGELLYQFTVEDPTMLTGPWRAEMSIRATKGKVFEYACHEGNYSMGGMLAGARREEREAAMAKAGGGKPGAAIKP